MFLLSKCTRCLLLNDGHESYVIVSFEDGVRQLVHLDLETFPALEYFFADAFYRRRMVRYLPKADAVWTF